MTPRGLWLVVTGTGRCGTKFTAQVLRGVGLKCTHQGVFRPSRGGPGSPEVLPSARELVTEEDIRRRVRSQKTPEWGWEAESSWCAAPYLGLLEMADVTKVHLVRHPKRVIDSLVKVQIFERRDRYGLYYDFAYHWVPEMREQDTLEARASVFYVRWNRMIEPYADLFWRVEDGPEGLLDGLGIGYGDRELFSDTRCNTRGGTPGDVRLDGLPLWLGAELLEMAERYGYGWGE